MKINAKKFVGCLSVIIVIMLFILLGITLPNLLNAKRSVWQSGAKRALREYGEAQLSYREINNERRYGSWAALGGAGYYDEGYSQWIIIENYSLFTSVFYPNRSTGRPTFTAVAFPLLTSPPGYLQTFAIREDQILRAYNPDYPHANDWGANDDYGTKSWEPIK